jgi:hypothetical protein
MNFSRFSKEEIESVIFCDLFFLKNRDDKDLDYFKKKWLNDFLHLNLNVPENENGEILFFRSLVRDDYKHLFHSIISAADEIPKIIVEDYISEKNIFNIGASKFLTKISFNIKYFNFVEEKYRLLIFIKFSQYLYMITMLERNNFANLVLFSDMQPVECLASIYFKKIGVTTVSLQHGLYIDYGDFDTVNVVNYKVQPSNYFLAWGDNTKKLIEKYNKSAEVYVCGKPDLLETKVVNHRPSIQKIFVICDQEIFQKHNIDLIQIVSDYCASKVDWSFNVKFHPHNNKPAYYKKFKDILESKEAEPGSIIVGISSSLLYEFGSLGCNVLQLKTNNKTISLDESVRFKNVVELRNCIDVSIKKTLDLTNIIKCIGKESKNNYKKFFGGLLSDRENLSVSHEAPFFSIIIPTFNSSLLIYKAINSLLNQKFKDFEVVIVDGLSTDNTIPYILSQTAGDSRFKVFSQKDLGIYDAMNIGLKKARGKWVYYLGSDDEFYSSSTLFDVMDFVNKSGQGYGMVYGNVKVKGDVKWAKDGTIYDGEFTTSKIKTKNICHQAIFYNRELKLTCDDYNLKYKLCADWDMNLRVWAKYGGSYHNKIVALFHAGGVSTNGSDPEFGKDFKNNILEYFGENN